MPRKFTVGQRRKGKNKNLKQSPTTSINQFNTNTFNDNNNNNNITNNNQTAPVEQTPSIMEYINNNDEATQSPLPPNAKRIAIAFLFEQLGAPYNTKNEPWSEHGSHDCVTAIIRRNLLISPGTDVASVLQDYIECRADGIQYTGFFNKNCGRPTILDTSGTEAQICANTQEEGFSITMSWTAINQHRREADLPSVTKSAVIGLVSKLCPKINKVKTVSQGNRDPNSTWATARWLFATQFLIRLGRIPSQHISLTNNNINNEENNDNNIVRTFIPDYWNSEKLTPINLSQIAWWDETHRRCKIGGIAGVNDCYPTFPRNKEGYYDPNGEYSTTIITQLKVKYQKEARFCLGVAAIKQDGNDNNNLVGRRLKPFVYSNKVILSIKDWKKKELQEISRVKNLSKSSYWCSYNRLENCLYLDDKIEKNKGHWKGLSKKAK
jgi:hypothetical protein